MRRNEYREEDHCVCMASVCAIATDGNGREMAVESTGNQELSIMDGKRSGTSCESRDGRGGQGPVASVMFTRVNGFRMRGR